MKQKIFIQILLVIVSVFGSVSFAQAVSEASLYFIPSTGTYQKSDEFDVELKLNSRDPVTSIKAYVSYDPLIFSIKSFQVNEATFPFWWEKESTPGLLKLQASVPMPGVAGEQTVATFHVRTERESGDAVFSIDPSSLVLGSDDEDILRVGASAPAGQGQLFLAAGVLTALILCGIIIFIISRKKKVLSK